MNPAREWIALILQSITLIAVVFSAIKVVNRNQREWEKHENRVDLLEREVSNLIDGGERLVAVEARLVEISSEMSRVRDRLDRFLDMQSATRERQK